MYTSRKPTPAEVIIAKQRLLEEGRYANINFDGEKQIIQLYTPSDLPPAEGSMIASAALEIIKRILPECKPEVFNSGEGCKGFFLLSSEARAIREVLLTETAQQKTSIQR